VTNKWSDITFAEWNVELQDGIYVRREMALDALSHIRISKVMSIISVYRRHRLQVVEHFQPLHNAWLLELIIGRE
jgi:hypothetical protein